MMTADWQYPLEPDDEYNRKLRNQVHPRDWQNPSPAKMYNLVVIGGSTAGLISAIITASLGGKVALIERHLMGGDCLNTGCVPSKSILYGARLAQAAREAAELRMISAEDPIPAKAFAKVMERLRAIRAEVSHHDSARRYRESGVDVFLGEGKFVDAGHIQVGTDILPFRKAVIATGARAALPDIPGLETCAPRTNETIFNLSRRPDRLLVIGAGPIGCELAQAFACLGSEVTILQRSKLLGKEEPDAAALVREALLQQGVNIWEGTTIERLERSPSGEKIVYAVHSASGERHQFRADEILVATGRLPNVEGLNLEAAAVQYDPARGILVNDFLQTTNRLIYAAGDCAMAQKFTHAADAAAQIVVQNALFWGRKRLSSLVIPRCTYTFPEIAQVGYTTQEARRNNVAFDRIRVELKDNDRALIDNRAQGFAQVLLKPGTDRILGACIVAEHAGDLLAPLTAAMTHRRGLSSLARVIHPYPTQADIVRRLAIEYNKRRLTPFTAGLLKHILQWQR